jgi:tetratricopeptide (TPR) repeat protein
LFNSATIAIALAAVCVSPAGLPGQQDQPAQQAPPPPGQDLEGLLEQETAADREADFAKRYPEVQAAAEKFANRDFQGAEETLEKAKAKYPVLPPAGVMLGMWHAQQRNGAASRASFEKAVRDEPGDPEPYVTFGENAIREGRFTDAGLLFDKGIQVAQQYSANPARKRTFLIRGYSGAAAVAEAREDWDAAEGALRKLLELDKQNIGALTRLGAVLFQKGAKEATPEARDKWEKEAYQVFQDVYKIGPETVARPEINMARLYQRNNRSANAAKLIKLARERAPDNLPTQIAAAQWAIETGDLPLAEQCAAAAVKIDPNNLQTCLLEGLAARLRSDHETAERAFQKAHELSPADVAALTNLAISLVEQPDEAKRRRALELALLTTRVFADQNDPSGRESALTLAWVYHRLGRDALAERQVQLALTSGSVGPEAAYYAAQILHDRGKPEPAQQLLKSALQTTTRIFPNRDAAQKLLDKIEAGP